MKTTGFALGNKMANALTLVVALGMAVSISLSAPLFANASPPTTNSLVELQEFKRQAGEIPTSNGEGINNWINILDLKLRISPRPVSKSTIGPWMDLYWDARALGLIRKWHQEGKIATYSIAQMPIELGRQRFPSGKTVSLQQVKTAVMNLEPSEYVFDQLVLVKVLTPSGLLTDIDPSTDVETAFSIVNTKISNMKMEVTDIAMQSYLKETLTKILVINNIEGWSRRELVSRYQGRSLPKYEGGGGTDARGYGAAGYGMGLILFWLPYTVGEAIVGVMTAGAKIDEKVFRPQWKIEAQASDFHKDMQLKSLPRPYYKGADGFLTFYVPSYNTEIKVTLDQLSTNLGLKGEAISKSSVGSKSPSSDLVGLIAIRLNPIEPSNWAKPLGQFYVGYGEVNTRHRWGFEWGFSQNQWFDAHSYTELMVRGWAEMLLNVPWTASASIDFYGQERSYNVAKVSVNYYLASDLLQIGVAHRWGIRPVAVKVSSFPLTYGKRFGQDQQTDFFISATHYFE
jgi:hypothetical protein